MRRAQAKHQPGCPVGSEFVPLPWVFALGVFGLVLYGCVRFFIISFFACVFCVRKSDKAKGVGREIRQM